LRKSLLAIFAAVQKVTLVHNALPPCRVYVQITRPASLLSWSRSFLLRAVKRWKMRNFKARI